MVGQREELEARGQWFRIEDSVYPKRACLIGRVDHLTWIFFDRSTWQAPQTDEWLPVNDRVTLGRLAETGREYFLRRANELLHWVNPIQGSLTRKVWDDLGAYRGVHEAALAALAEWDDARTAPGGPACRLHQGRCLRTPGQLRCTPIGELLIQCDHTE